MLTRNTIALLWLCVAFTACASQRIPEATQAAVQYAQQGRPQTTLEELQQGRRAYVSHCGNCHRLVDPRKVSAEQWPGKVYEMGTKARIPQDQMELIVLYLVSAAKTAPPPG